MPWGTANEKIIAPNSGEKTQFVGITLTEDMLYKLSELLMLFFYGAVAQNV